MDYEQASDIVRQLADGLDPTTGDSLPDGDPCQNPHVVRALHLANRALARQDELTRKKRDLPKNAGSPWTDDDDRRLLEEFDAKTPVKELASRHGRTVSAIEARLAKLGKLPGNRTRYRF